MKFRHFAGLIAVSLLSLQAQTFDSPGIAVEPGAKIMERTPVFFPAGATTVGSVVVESTVNAKGAVTDAHVVSGPAELRLAALSSVLNWRFSSGPATVQSTIRFAGTPSAVSEDACLGGVWAQEQPNDWRWRFQLQDSGLSISRTDGFVSGTFTRTGTVWTGQLQWGSGETWNNVVLSPTGTCKEVHTNQIWSFKR
jgi:hypothetical protein